MVNPYGEGGASETIVKALEVQPLEGLLKKKFYNISFGDA
jgi:GDP/UDP-N,N'-diacetylbacillosamine 2-epimerase (hydrolysing)